MSCKVEIVLASNGKESQLYNTLEKALGSSQGLDTYLTLMGKSFKANSKVFGLDSNGEIDGKSYINSPKFKQQFQSQIDITEIQSEYFLDAMREIPGVSSKLNISGVDIAAFTSDPTNLSKAINITKEIFEDAIAHAYAQDDADYAEFLRSSQESIEVDIASEDGFLGPLGVKLVGMGVGIRPATTDNIVDEVVDEQMADNQEDIDEDTIETIYNIVYDKHETEKSPDSSVLSDVRLYLSNLPRVDSGYIWGPETGAPTEGDYDYNEVTGLPKKLDSHKIGSKLFGILKGTENIADMMTKLEKALITSPELAPIYYDLKEEIPIKAKQVHRSVNGKIIEEIRSISVKKNAMLSTFAKQSYDMFSMFDYGKGDVQFRQSNQNSGSNRIIANWEGSVMKVQTDLSKSRKESLKEQLNKIAASEITVRNKYNQMVKATFNEAMNMTSNGLPAPNITMLRRLASIYNKAGFSNITENDFVALAYAHAHNPNIYNDKKNTESIATFAELINKLNDRVLIRTLNGENIFGRKSEGEAMGEMRALRLLASPVLEREPDLMAGSFVNTSGKIKHQINLSSFAQDVLTKASRSEGEPIHEDLVNNTVVMAASSDPNFRAQTFDEFADKTSGKKSTAWNDMPTVEILQNRFNGFFSGTDNTDYFRAMGITQANRGNTLGLILPKIKSREQVEAWTNSKLSLEMNRIRKDYMEAVDNDPNRKVFKTYSTVIDSKGNVKYGRAAVFNTFTSLNEVPGLMDRIRKGNESINDLVREHMDAAMKSMSTTVDEDVQFLVDQGFIKNTNGIYTFTALATEHLSTKSREANTSDIRNFLMNNFISTVDQTQLFMGDLAFYKSDIDVNKRFSLPFTPGVRTSEDVGETYFRAVMKEPKVKSEIASLLNSLGNTTAYDEIELGDGLEFISMNMALNTTMGRGLQNEGFLTMMNRTVRNGGKNLNTVKNWLKNDRTVESQKPFYFDIHEDEFGNRYPVSSKTSFIPANPEFFEQLDENLNPKYPGLYAISKLLNSPEFKAQTLPMVSAAKAGSFNHVSIEDIHKVVDEEIDLPPKHYQEMNTASLRFPQKEATKNSILKKMGSQMRVLIQSNYEFLQDEETGDYEETGYLLHRYNNSIGQIIETGVKKIYNKLSPSLRPEGEIKKELVKESEKSTYENSEYMKQALLESKGESSLASFAWPPVRSKLSSILTKRFRKAAVGFKLPGYDAVQISSMGTGEIGIDSDLNFSSVVRRDGKDIGKDEMASVLKDMKNKEDLSPERLKELGSLYKMSPAEIRITPNYFMNSIKKKVLAGFKPTTFEQERMEEQSLEFLEELKQDDQLTDQERTEFVDQFKKQLLDDLKTRRVEKTLMNFTDSEGNFDLEKINRDDSELTEVVLYRTPTQGKNSMLLGKIKSLLPPTMGNSIMVPAELVTQSGSDFDIDKVAIFFPEHDLDKMTREGARRLIKKADSLINDLYNTHKIILSSITSSSELLSPNSTELLEGDVNKDPAGNPLSIRDTYGMNEPINNFFNMRAQEIFRINNASGDMMIGRSSLASIFKTNAKLIGFKFSKEIFGEPFDVTRTYNDNGTLISKDIEAVQNAALDNASNPLLGNLNINDETSDVFLAMVLAGKGLPFATAVLNAPIVRTYSRYKLLYANKGDREASRLAQLNTLSDHNIDPITFLNNKPGSSYDYTSAHLAATNMKADPYAQMSALHAYMDLNKGPGKALSSAIQDFSFTSKGPGGTLSFVLKKAMSLAKVKGTVTNRNRESISEYEPRVDIVTPDMLVSRIRENQKKIERKPGGWVVKDTGRVLKGVSRFLFGESQIDAKYQINADVGNEIDSFGRAVLNPNVVGEYYTPSLLRNNPDKIYVFGDNNQEQGKGGQATIRDEENAFGIPTKKAPSNNPDAFYSDLDYEDNVKRIDEAVKKIKDDGRKVMFPKDGIGTGLAQLKSKAPKTYDYLVTTLKEKFNYANGGESTSSSLLSEKAQKKLTAHFNRVRRELEKIGVTNIISDEDSLRVYDEKKGVLGVLDVLVASDSNKYAVLDIKSRSKLFPADWGNEETGAKRIQERTHREEKQVNAYREILRNSYNIPISSVGIIDIKPIIENGVVVDVEFPSKPFRVLNSVDVLGDTRRPTKTEEDVLNYREGTDEKKPYEVDPELYLENHISSVESASFLSLLQLANEIVPTVSYGYQKTLETFEDRIGYIAPNQEERILSALDTFLLMNSGSIGAGLKSGMAQFNNRDYRHDMMSAEGGVGSRVQAYIDKKNAAGEDLNPFIEALNVVHLNNDLSKKFVTVNSSYNRGLTKDKQIDLMNAFEALLNSDDVKERDLARRLSSYALMNYGFNTSPHSFLGFIPPVAFSYDMGSYNNPLETFRVGLEENGVYNDREAFSEANINEFIRMYVQNNATSLGIPTYSLAGIEERNQMAENDLPYVFISKRVGGTKDKPIFQSELHELGSTGYVPLQQKGITGYATEYGDYSGSIFNENPDKLGEQSSAASVYSETNPENLKSIKAAEDSFAEVRTVALSEISSVLGAEITSVEDLTKRQIADQRLTSSMISDFMSSNMSLLQEADTNPLTPDQLEAKLQELGTKLGSKELGDYFALFVSKYRNNYNSGKRTGLQKDLVASITDVVTNYMDIKMKEQYFKCKN